MAKLVVKARSVFAGSLDLAGNLNEATLDLSAPEVDMTNFASGGWYEGMGGIAKAAINFQGFWEAAGTLGNPDFAIHSRLGLTNPITLGMNYPPAAGDISYFVNALETQYTLGGMVGAAARLGLTATGTAPVVRGKYVEVVTSGATHNSASRTFAAVTALQRLAVLVHVTAASGTTPTLDLIIESDADDTYGSPTTRFTIPQFTTIGYHYATLAGPITDVEYRVGATIAGASASFTYRVSLGIYTPAV